MTEKARSSRSSSSSPHLVVGRIGRAVGLKGEVEVLIVSDAPDRFAPGSVLLRRDTLAPLTVSGHRRHRDRTMVSFAEVSDRTGAEALRGAELVIPAGNARSLETDEYWDHDLLECVVVTVDGTEIGVVTDLLHQPANEVLVVRRGSREFLVPLVSTVVKEVEPRQRITIDPPPGLLENE